MTSTSVTGLPGPVPPSPVKQTYRDPQFIAVLDDLCCRFILNSPEEEFASFETICFQIELAHWFYEDFYKEKNPKLPSFNLREFVKQMFLHCPILQPYANRVAEIMEQFTQYKIRIPVYGGIILNPTLDKCILVKGWAAKSGWGFPKGKINKDESEMNCAIREVLEETGFDISDRIREENSVEVTIREQKIKLYIIPHVPEDTVFIPRTRKEISKIEWVPIKDLPTSFQNKIPTPFVKNPNNLFMVIPFVGKLKAWVQKYKMQVASGEPVRNTSPGHPNHESRRRHSVSGPFYAPKINGTTPNGVHTPNGAANGAINGAVNGVVSAANIAPTNGSSVQPPATESKPIPQNGKLKHFNNAQLPPLAANMGSPSSLGAIHEADQTPAPTTPISSAHLPPLSPNRDTSPTAVSPPLPACLYPASAPTSPQPLNRQKQKGEPITRHNSFLSFRFDVDDIMKSFTQD